MVSRRGLEPRTRRLRVSQDICFQQLTEDYIEYKLALGHCERSYLHLPVNWVPAFKDHDPSEITTEDISTVFTDWVPQRFLLGVTSLCFPEDGSFAQLARPTLRYDELKHRLSPYRSKND